MDAVHMLNIVLVETSHQHRARAYLSWCEEQVHMIRHQTIGVHRATRVARERLEVAQIRKAISVAKEAVATVVPALNDMERHTGDHVAGTSRHAEKTTEPLC